MPIIESNSPLKYDYPKSVVFRSLHIRAPESLIFPKSVCKILEFKMKEIDGSTHFKVDVPQWLLSKMVEEFDLDDYGFKIML